METPTNPIDAIRLHLEFLGYKITGRDSGFRADGTDSQPRIMLVADKGAGFLFTASYTPAENAKTNRLGYLEWVNQMNRESALITAFVSDDSGLTFAGWFPKTYEKQLFAGFFRTFCDDVKKCLFGPNAKAEEFLA